MKKALVIYMTVIAMTLFSLGSFAQSVSAKELVLEAKVKNVTKKNDKNGSPFMRGFVEQERTLNGVKYKVDVPVIAFSNLEKFRKDASDGEIKAIVKEQEYNGGVSYLYRTSIN